MTIDHDIAKAAEAEKSKTAVLYELWLEQECQILNILILG
jgi:hypothetical protein